MLIYVNNFTTKMSPSNEREHNPSKELLSSSEPLFSEDESWLLFGIHGPMLLAFSTGKDTRFGVFDVSSAPTASGVRRPFANHPDYAVAANEHYIVAQLDAAPHTTGQDNDSAPLYEPIRNGRITLGREHHQHSFAYTNRVSRNHAEVFVDERGKASVLDLGSANGTKLLERDDFIDVGAGFMNMPEYSALRKLFKQELALMPARDVRIDDYTFSVSNIIEGTATDIAILYAIDAEQTWHTHLLYRSYSGGDWHVTSGLNASVFEKGGGRHYTQETKLNPKLIDAIAALETDKHENKNIAQQVEDVFRKSGIDAQTEFKREVAVVAVDDPAIARIAEIRAGRLKHQYTTVDQLRQHMLYTNETLRADAAREAPRFMPDITENGMTACEEREHTLLGRCVYTKFRATINGREAFWEFGDNGKGTVWIDRIGFVDSSVTSYGTDSEVIDSGFLTSKPLEYESQINAIPVSLVRDTDTKYKNIGLFLAQLEPIKQYNRFKQIVTQS